MQPGSLGTAFVWAVLPAVVLLVLLYWIDRYEKEPIRLLSIALLFGAVLAPVVAVLIEKAAGVPTSMAVQATVPQSRLNATTPIVEGVVLGLTIAGVFLLVRQEVDGLLDGLIYGAVVGIGFAMTANFVAILSTHSIDSDVTPSLFAAMVSGLNYLFYGGVVGLALAAVRNRSAGVLAAAGVVGIAVETGLRLVHDYLPWWVASPATAAAGSTFRGVVGDLPNVLGLVALGAIVAWTAGKDASVVGGELRDEVAAGVVTAQEYRVVTHSVRRAWMLTTTLFTRGEHEWRLRRELFALEVELAYRKRRRRTKGAYARRLPDEDAYRARIAEVRGKLSAHLLTRGKASSA